MRKTYWKYFAGLTVFISLAASAQQTMPNKWDQTCLDNAGKKYMSCMASSGTNEPAKQKCQEEKAKDEKQCKK